MIYTSATLSLAALEYLVHLDAREAPDDLVAIPADMPDETSVLQVRISDLPVDWRTYPAPESLADLGTSWAQGGKTTLLAEPSAVVPRERNYLMNPAHPGFKAIRVGSVEPFSFDPRIGKHRGVRS